MASLLVGFSAGIIGRIPQDPFNGLVGRIFSSVTDSEILVAKTGGLNSGVILPPDKLTVALIDRSFATIAKATALAGKYFKCSKAGDMGVKILVIVQDSPTADVITSALERPSTKRQSIKL
jgi:hypothetical protein